MDGRAALAMTVGLYGPTALAMTVGPYGLTALAITGGGFIIGWIKNHMLLVSNKLSSLRAQRGSPSPRTSKMDGRAALAMTVGLDGPTALAMTVGLDGRAMLTMTNMRCARLAMYLDLINF